MVDKREVCNCSAYPFPHKRWGGQCTGDNDDEMCRHGYPVGEYCGYCEVENYACDLYHAKKDDGVWVK